MINILFIHGLGSSSKSSTGQLLHDMSNEQMMIYNPSFSLSPKKAIEEINKLIDDYHIDMVIGSSLGGFYALQCDCNYGVVINPALTPINDIKTAIGYGEHPYVNGEGNYIIDENFISELEWVIKRNYQGDNPNEWYKYLNKSKVFAGIFGKQDELFSHYEDFKCINNETIVLLDDMHHRFDKKYASLLKSFIEKMINVIH